MDINGTKFHLLTGENDWAPRLESNPASGLWWDHERAGLSITPKVLSFGQEEGLEQLTSEERRGASCDRYGNIFWIGESEREIFFLAAGEKESGIFWDAESPGRHCGNTEMEGDFSPAGKEKPLHIKKLKGLAVTDHQYLIVGALQPSGLLIFDLHAGGPPVWNSWPDEKEDSADKFHPFDISSAPDGGTWILERDGEESAARCWLLDRFFRVVASSALSYGGETPFDGDFGPLVSAVDGEHSCSIKKSVSLEYGIAIDVKYPVAVEGLPDGTVLIVGSSPDSKYSIVYRYGFDKEKNAVELKNAIELKDDLLKEMLGDGRLKVHDFVCIAQRDEKTGMLSGELTIVPENGNQAYLFWLEADDKYLKLILRPAYLPLRRFGGKALLEARGDVYYDFEGKWLPLVSQPRYRFKGEGEVVINELDGKEPDCIWHRIILDAYIPDGSAIVVESRAANEEGLLRNEDWFEEPAPCLRLSGSEIPMHEPFTDTELKRHGTGTWDLLFQKAKGRFLELKLTLKGDGRTSPRIRAMRVYYPRYSYLERHLPDCYRDDPESASFLDRFLSNVEGFYSSIEGRIAGAEALLDVRTAPPDYLEWLAGWLGAELDPDWDDYRRRLFISNALLLYRWRGTQVGLRAAIRLAIDPCPDESIFDELREPSGYRVGAMGGRSVRIVENFLTRKFPGVLLGDPGEFERPGMISAGEVLKDAGVGDNLSLRYRDFLRRSYSGSGGPAIDRLNMAWEENFSSFDDIYFPSEAPDQKDRKRDWTRFIRREIDTGRPWTPGLGASSLHVRFREYLCRLYDGEGNETEALERLNERWGSDYDSFDRILFSPVLPSSGGTAEDWRLFVRNAIGFTYAEVKAGDAAAYIEFLARRYRQISRYNTAYGLSGDDALESFSGVRLPGESDLPKKGRPLSDWIQFVSFVLPVKRNAHRFTVLVPTEPEESHQSRDLRMGKVKRIIDREKPAHTDYDLKFYWALFQVGNARLGLDSIIGKGSRYTAMVLGKNYLGQGYLEYSHPWSLTDRSVVGRDRLKAQSATV